MDPNNQNPTQPLASPPLPQAGQVPTPEPVVINPFDSVPAGPQIPVADFSTAPSLPVSPTPEPQENLNSGASFDPSPTLTPPLTGPSPQPSIPNPAPPLAQAGSVPTFAGGEVTEAAPTDLSHLMTPSQPEPSPTSEPPPVDPNIQVVQPAQPGSEVSAQVVTASNSHGFPKWVLLGGIILLLLVAAGSAYFILGVGQNPLEETTSLPAVQQPLTSPPGAATPDPEPAQSGAESSFSELNGASASAEQASGSAQAGGSSAIDLIKQRQGQQ